MKMDSLKNFMSPFMISFGDGDLTELFKWRIISLLTHDYRILLKALAKRIEKYLSKLVISDQTRFVKERYIGPKDKTFKISYAKIQIVKAFPSQISRKSKFHCLLTTPQ